jgi:hypothetical protein
MISLFTSLGERKAARSNPELPLQNHLLRARDGIAEASLFRGFWNREGRFEFPCVRSSKMTAFVLFFFFTAVIARINAAPHSALQKEKTVPTAGPAAVFTPDKGKFRILLNGQSIGAEEFEISRSGDAWTAHGSTTAHAPGGTDIKADGQLKLSADGAPLRYTWSAEAAKKATGVVEFDNGTAKCSASLGAASPLMKDFKFETPRIAVLDNNLYHQYAVLAQMYDWKAGGKQNFPVVIPQDLTPGSISVEAIGPQQVDGVTYQSVRVTSTDLEILLYLDANRRLMRIDVPSSKVTIQRE